MNFQSHSQAGQDLFVHALLPQSTGWYVEAGCAHPIELSNTYALEQLGWRGAGVDLDPGAVELHRKLRTNAVWQGDATRIDWEAKLLMVRPEVGPVVDYASVDIDEYTHEALLNLLLHSGRRFRVLTVEHDHYQRGDLLRLPNRAMLAAHGYELLCADVHNTGCNFEDWFVDPKLVDMAKAGRFRSTGLDWRDVLKQGGAL